MDKIGKSNTGRFKATGAAKRIPGMVRQSMVEAPLKAKEEGRPVAYCFICSLYDEIIRAMDIVPTWVENYAGIVASKRAQDRFLDKAESEGYSKSLCTYATCDLGFDAIRHEIGAMPPDAPWGGIPKPDMILGAGLEICDPRYKWTEAIQRYMDVPTYIVGLPWPSFSADLKKVEEVYIKYVTAQLRGLVEFIEQQTRKKMEWDRLWDTIHLAEKTYSVWWDINTLRSTSFPTPMDTSDSMNTMVPGTFMLGTQEAYDFYLDLHKEVKERVDCGIGLVPQEKYRILWGGGLAPWFALGEFDYFKSKGAVFPIENSYKPFWEPFELPKCDDPLEHLSRRWIKFWTYRFEKARHRLGSDPDVETLIEYIEKAHVDGVLMHSCFSCRSWHVGLVKQLTTLQKVYRYIPTIILESDMVDASSYSEIDAHARIDAFIETMETYKNE